MKHLPAHLCVKHCGESKSNFFILDTDVDVETEYKGKSLQL